MTLSSNDNTIRLDHAQGILELTGINDDRLLNDPMEYWYRVTLALHIPADTGNELANAQQCIEKMGGGWDEESFSEDGSVNDAGYDELYSLLMNLETSRLSEILAGTDEEEDYADEEEVFDQSGTISHSTVQREVYILVSEILSGEINLSPEFQREYVWPREKALKYIESLLIDIPTPSILLYKVTSENEDRLERHDVVDGRQRLETLLRFMGTQEELARFGRSARRLKTPKETELKYRSFQPGGSNNVHANKFYSDLSELWQQRFRNRKIPVTIIEADNRKMLYHVFERYNVGSQKLNAAEIRNAVYQELPIHRTIWELARDSQASSAQEPNEESSAIALLKDVMGRKTRYGTYDFIGRVMAFTHLNMGEGESALSANLGTNKFFETFDEIHGNHQKLRQDFVKAFYTVMDWYGDYGFTKPPTNDSTTLRGSFNAWAATIQMATTHHLMLKIEEGLLDEEKIKEVIEHDWPIFAGIDPDNGTAYKDDEVGAQGQPSPGIFQTRQNAINFWRLQTEWHDSIQCQAVST